MQYLHAHSVKETVAKKSDSHVYAWYTVGEYAIESGYRYKVKDIRVSDSFGSFHVEVELEEFGTLWLYDINKIIFSNAERGTLQNDKEGDTVNEDTLRKQ